MCRVHARACSDDPLVLALWCGSNAHPLRVLPWPAIWEFLEPVRRRGPLVGLGWREATL